MRSISLLSAVLLAGAAHAAEVTLYKQPNFGGNQLTIRAHTPTLANTGFYDLAASLVVHSGRWEFCSQPDFKGDCVTLNRGEYPALDPRLNHRIESAREVGAYAGQTGSYRRYGRGSIEIFARPGFAGRALTLERDTPTLEGTGFDDRAASVVVNEGTWQLCAHPGYAGACRTYGPGRYADLGARMAKQVTSARLVRNRRDAPLELGGGVSAPDFPDDGRSRVILFSRNNFAGESMAVAGASRTLDRTAFDDAAASMIVEGGRFVFCTEEYFRGDCKEIGPGRYPNLTKVGLRKAISSIRPLGAPASPVARRPAGADIQLFEATNFEGRVFASKRDVANLGPTEFNDRTSSVVVSEGRWELCSNGSYDGQCVVVGPGRYASLGGLNNQISSLRRVR